jgi:hypothetical protein
MKRQGKRRGPGADPSMLTGTSTGDQIGAGELRFPRPRLGQTVAGGAGLHEPVLAGGDHQWVGGSLVHDRLRPVWRRHDQNRDPASLGRNPGCCGRSGPSAGLGHFPPSFYGRMAGRHPGQREPWARLGVVRLSDVARTGRFGRARVRKPGLTVSTGSSEVPPQTHPAQCGCTWDWSPHWCCHTILGRGVA